MSAVFHLTCGTCVLNFASTSRHNFETLRDENLAVPFPSLQHCTQCTRQNCRVYALKYSLTDLLVRYPEPNSQAPAGEDRRNTYVLEEDCPACFEQDGAGHRMCLQCSASCCNTCWSKIDKCPLCRFRKN
jgi:hypothetical protein